MPEVSNLSPVEPFYYSGQGEVFIGPVGGYDPDAATPEGFEFIGNAPTFTLTPNEEATDHKESTTGERSVDRRIVTERTLTGSITCEQWSIGNLERFWYGKRVDQAAGVVTNESIGDPPVDEMIPLAKQGVSAVSIVDSTGAPLTLPAGQYQVDEKAGCIRITDKTTGGPYVTPFKVNYTHQARVHVPIFKVPSGTNFMLRFNGLNTAESDADGHKSVVLEIYKLEFIQGQEAGFINEELGPLTLNFVAKVDTDRDADATLGRFGQIIMPVPVEEQ